MPLSSNWMGINLKSPVILASITLFSKVRKNEHLEYYKKAVNYGAGAIVLPSVNPAYHNKSLENSPVIEVKMIDSGMGGKMGFSVLGPTNPNLISVEYGVELAKELSETVGVPIFGSVANIGTQREFLETVDKLVNTGIQGIELNFSCPNVITKNSERTNLTIGVLKEIRKHCLLPISLKLPATFADMDFLEQLQDEINGITVSNAHIGLLPPEIKKNKIFSAFDKTEVWCPTGIYGPQERMLTYYSLYKFSRMVKRKGWSIASVGGYMTGEHVFQAILLGADVVQMSSAVAWKGLAVFRSSNCELEKCVNMIGEEDVQSVKRIAVDSVFKNADSVKGYMNDRKAVVTVNCKRCKVCQCCERFCIAITQNSEKEVCIDSSLCSGCGWCVQSCKHHGIQFE